MRLAAIRLAAVGIVAVCGFAAGAQSAEPEPFVPLREAVEPRLQAALTRTVERAGLADLARQKRLGIALAGLTDPSCPRFAAVNGDVTMYAASLPKIGILLAALVKVEAGQLELTDALREQLGKMIRKSSNGAATSVMRTVGPEYIASVLRSPRFHLYDPATGGGLWIGKEYSKKAAWRRDPVRGLSHAASATQVARFYYLLETGRLLSPKLTDEMRSIMNRPGLSHKFVAAIRSEHPDARFLRKSGTWRDWHTDSAVIQHDGKRYIAVGLVQSAKGEKILRDLVLQLDHLIFEIPPVCPEELEPPVREPSRPTS